MTRAVLLLFISLTLCLRASATPRCVPLFGFLRGWFQKSPSQPAKAKAILNVKIDSVIRNDLYSPDDYLPHIQNALFLSDGTESVWSPTRAQDFARKHPKVKVTKTDLMLDETYEKGNVTSVKLDNNDPFPDSFEDKFDLITLDAGVCFHGMSVPGLGFVSCAGIPGKKEPALAFFRKVFKSLNSKNPNAKAFLGAAEGKINREQLQALVDAAHELELETDGAAHVKLVHRERGLFEKEWGYFLGFEITRRPAQNTPPK